MFWEQNDGLIASESIKQTKKVIKMKRELGIARCGLACCVCSENEKCRGCNSEDCPDTARCVNKKCSEEKNLSHCYACAEDCRKGLLAKIKPYAFTLFIKRYGEEKLLDCLEANEKNGVVYHRKGIIGDYDDFDDADELIEFIISGKRGEHHEYQNNEH